MKKLLFLFCFLFTLYSNGQSNARQKLAGNLQGYWLNESYLQKIEKSKSIFQNQEYSSLIWGFILDSINLMSDSIYLNGFHVHEGGYGAFLTYNANNNSFRSDASKNEEYSNFYQHDFFLDPHGKKLHMVFLDKQRVDIFRKVEDEQIELRKILFSEPFTNDKEKQVIFSSDGSLSGFKKYISFDVVYDFTEGLQFDAILCHNKSGNRLRPDIYKYEFKDNELLLYKVKTNWKTLERTVSKKPIILTPVEN